MDSSAFSPSLSIVSLFPPLVVLLLGYFTHRVMLALGAGIVFAALLAENFSIWPATASIVKSLWNNLEFGYFFSLTDFWQCSNMFIFIFLLVLGIFVTMLQVSGGAYAYANFAKRKVKSAKSAETASLVLSTGLFVDDYLSALTVGSVMSPLTDTQRVPRLKLAYLVDTMAAPLAILCPFSSWVAAIVGFLKENGVREDFAANTLVHANPLATFIHIMPFIFYSFILVAATWFIVRFRISFGLIRKCELIARETGDVFCGHRHTRKDNVEHNPAHTTLLEFFVPIGVLLLGVLSGILYSGGWWLLGGSNSFWQACQESSATAGLFIGGNFTIIICTIFFVLRKRIAPKALPGIFWQGIQLMLPAVLVLLFAWTLGDFLRNQLHTGEYLAGLMLNAVSITFLPLLMFITAGIVAFTIGSAWGTAAMLFPIAIPLVLSMTGAPAHAHLQDVTILFPVLGAVLSGCIAGNHVSPIADTTVMSSMSTQVNMRQHVYSQIQYASPGIIATGVAFLLCGCLQGQSLVVTYLVPIAAAIGLNCVLLSYLNCGKLRVKSCS